MTKIKKDGTKLVIETAGIARTKIQELNIQKFVSEGDYTSLFQYIESFQGKKTRSQKIQSQRYDKTPDPYYPNKYRDILESFIRPRANHTPYSYEQAFKREFNDWIGVEIECFLSKDTWGYSEDSGHTCPDCEGSGSWYNENRDCNEDCTRCDGSGTIDSDGDSDGNIEPALESIARSLRQGKIKLTSVTDDGSLDPDDGDLFGVEFRCLTRLSDTKNLENLCAWLKKHHASVNSSCGLHVHFDVRSLSQSEVSTKAERIKTCLPILSKCVPRSRRDNRYCQLGIGRQDRYYAINLTSVDKHGTMEIRLHSGTTDFKKIMNWTRLILQISNSESLDDIGTVGALSTLFKRIELDESLKTYISQRFALFNDGDCTDESAVDDDSDEYNEISA